MKKIQCFLLMIIFFIIISSYQIKAINNEDTGSITGYVYYYDSTWGPMIMVKYAFVNAGIEHDFSNRHGYYEINNLPINRYYNISIYSLCLKSETKSVYLTQDIPNQMLDFELIRASGVPRLFSILYYFYFIFLNLKNISY